MRRTFLWVGELSQQLGPTLGAALSTPQLTLIQMADSEKHTAYNLPLTPNICQSGPNSAQLIEAGTGYSDGNCWINQELMIVRYSNQDRVCCPSSEQGTA